MNMTSRPSGGGQSRFDAARVTRNVHRKRLLNDFRNPEASRARREREDALDESVVVSADGIPDHARGVRQHTDFTKEPWFEEARNAAMEGGPSDATREDWFRQRFRSYFNED